MSSTPNTPANGGKILTWQERREKFYKENVHGNPGDGKFMAEEIADLRASLAAPAIPTVDRNAEAAEDFASWLAREMPAGTVIGNPAWWAPRILRAAGIAQPAAQGAVMDAAKSTLRQLEQGAHNVAANAEIRGDSYDVGYAKAMEKLCADTLKLFATPATVKTAEGL